MQAARGRTHTHPAARGSWHSGGAPRRLRASFKQSGVTVQRSEAQGVLLAVDDHRVIVVDETTAEEDVLRERLDHSGAEPI